MRKKYTLKHIAAEWFAKDGEKVRGNESFNKAEGLWNYLRTYIVDRANEFGVVNWFEGSTSYLSNFLFKHNIGSADLQQNGLIVLDESTKDNHIYYKMSEDLRKVFKNSNWYSWLASNGAPEDPFFLRDGELLVSTVIHEGIIVFYLTEEELNEFSERFPDLTLVEIS